MSGERFTPGPWKVSNYRPYDIIARDPMESTYELSDDKYAPIATVNRHGLNNQQEFFPNARLIAAAPEMYDVLKTTANNIKSLIRVDGVGPFCKWLDAVEEVLKKARGEQ